VVATFSLAGSIALSIPGGSGSYVFAGPTASITVTANQRLTGAATLPIGLASGAEQTVDIGLCFQIGAAPITNFAAGNYSTQRVATGRRSYGASATTTLAAGTYLVGACVRNTGAGAINDNDFVNGWITVTN
jgi:hypothetical protein